MREQTRENQIKRRDFLKAATLAAAGGVLAAREAAVPPPAAAQAVAAKAAGPKKGGTFTLAQTGTVMSFNPLAQAVTHLPFQRAIYDVLVGLDLGLNPQPGLAEKWDVTPDGKQVTLKLRQGVKFHSGREFTSEDVKFSWHFASTDDSATLRNLFKAIKQVETVEKYVAVLRLDSLNPGLFDILDTLYIIDKETVKDAASFANAGIGTGPFKVDKYVPNDRIEAVAFRDFWDQGRPHLDKYVIRQIPDLATLAINLETGSIDCAAQPSFRDLARLKESGKYVADSGALNRMFDIGINVQVEMFRDRRVRQAIAWSIDRARFCRTVLMDIAQPSCLMWPDISWAYFKDLEGKIGFDLEKAKGLLKDAGLEKGFDVEIMTSSRRGLGYGELPQIMQADLKKIGINVKIADVEVAVWTARHQKADHQMMMHSYGRASRDPGTLVTSTMAWYSKQEGGMTNFQSPEYDRLRKELQSTLDRKRRLPVARRIQELVLEECFTVIVAPDPRPWVYAPYVKGFTYDSENAPIVHGVWLDK